MGFPAEWMFWIVFLNRYYNSFQPGIYLLCRRFCEFGNYQLPNWNREVFGMQNMKSSDKFFGQVVQLFRDAKRKMSMAVNMAMVYSYYEAGRMIIDEEQNGDERAAYGKYILQELSRQLTVEFGRGFSYENLKLMRRFYVVYSKDVISDSIFSHSDQLPMTTEGRRFYLSWSHYLILMRIKNVEERHFYEIEAYRNGWSKDELGRQYGSSLYERLALSKEKEEVIRLALEGQQVEKPDDIFKDPYVLEFTGLPEEAVYSETELEKRLIDNLQMYVNYYDRKVKLEDENPTIGIIICKDKKDAVVEMTLPKDNNQIFASKYQTVLPSKEELQQLMNEKE